MFICVGDYRTLQLSVLTLYLHDKLFKIVTQFKKIRSKYPEKFGHNSVRKRTVLTDFGLLCTLVINALPAYSVL